MINTGQVIKELRIHKKLTQEQLAELVGVTKNSIQKYEDGTVKNLKVETIRKLCLCFDVPPWMLIFPENIEPSPVEVMINIHQDLVFTFESRDILKYYFTLNNRGKEKALDYLRDLNRIQEYKKYANSNMPHSN